MDAKERHISSGEVFNSEKQLCSSNNDRQELYHKTRSSYERLIMNDHELSGVQDVEYSLWKLHYKHINEFRKRIRKSKNDDLIEEFNSFLSDASQFYEDLITKIKKSYGILDENRKDGESSFNEPMKLCHRFLVCVGDLARYKKLYKKSEIQNRDWSVAESYYLQATSIWPDGGNPHNQLALLATYVGDELLALYRSVRSLAVKEPFPDAWDNFILLFEKNRSTQLSFLYSEARFDFSKPSESGTMHTKTQLIDGSLNSDTKVTEYDCSVEKGLWSLFIRTISYFFIKSSLEDFPHTFASTMLVFETLMQQDDTKLKASLFSSHFTDSTKTHPNRCIQLVSVLIFAIHDLTKNPDEKETELTQLALSATFIFMGRIVDRCSKANHPFSCPLLPALLVFVEWLTGTLEKVETLGHDEKSKSAIVYFFASFVELLNRFDYRVAEIESSRCDALWEDHELQGFSPIAHTHVSLDFSNRLDDLQSRESRDEYRVHRIVHAANKMVNRSSDSRKWIFYDETRRKFSTECSSGLSETRENAFVEEEEIILFKPITRFYSAPVSTSATTNDEISVGPPSLNAWVLNRQSLRNGLGPLGAHALKPIAEITGDSVSEKDNTFIDFGHISSASATTCESPTYSRNGLGTSWTRDLKATAEITGASPRFSRNGLVPLGTHTLEPIVEKIGDSVTEKDDPFIDFGHISSASAAAYDSPTYSRNGLGPLGTHTLKPIMEVIGDSFAEKDDPFIDFERISSASAATHDSPPTYSRNGLGPLGTHTLKPITEITGDSVAKKEVPFINFGHISSASAATHDSPRTYSRNGLGPLGTHTLKPAAVITTDSVSEKEDPFIDFGHISSASDATHDSPYSALVPSAPLLHDDATWFGDNTSPRESRDYFSEWLNQNKDNHDYDASRFDLFDRWGSPMKCVKEEPLLSGYPPVHGYVCGGRDMRAHQEQIVLQYLKKRESRMRQELKLNGPFM